MKLEFKDVINKHKGTPALVLAHGPSLNTYLNKLDTLKSKGYILIGCNEWFSFYKNVPPHYHVLANNIYTINRLYQTMNQYDTTVVYADSVDLTDRNWVKNNLKCNYLPYDQRHFNSGGCGCNYPCCSRIIPGRLTIQEELTKYSNINERYNSGDTVALHSMSLAVLLGCNPIYFIGLDLDYSLGFASHKDRLLDDIDINNKLQVACMNDYTDRNIENLLVINKAAKAVGTSILNLNKNSKFDIFPISEI
jgi:hypothetical protein